jgi:predicted PurR-regulated permease PerM
MNRFLPSLSPAGAQWARLFGLLLAAGLLAAAVVSLRPVLTPLLAALALAYILNPLVTWFEKRGCGRLLTIAAIAFLASLHCSPWAPIWFPDDRAGGLVARQR